jgi:hypothetical protein
MKWSGARNRRLMGLVLGMPEKWPMTELASKRMGDSFLQLPG